MLNDTPCDQLLNVRDLAGILDISSRTIWRMVADGELPPPIRLSRNIVRWRASAIQAYLDARTPIATAERQA